MKKFLMVLVLLLASVYAFAIPSGCYEGSTRHSKGRCAIQISGNTLNVINKEGNVIASWTIVNDSNGTLTLKSSLDAVMTATWWQQDGKVYLNWNYETYTRM